jgi:hypothetical protein
VKKTHDVHIFLEGRIFVHLGCRFLALDHLLLQLELLVFLVVCFSADVDALAYYGIGEPVSQFAVALVVANLERVKLVKRSIRSGVSAGWF